MINFNAIRKQYPVNEDTWNSVLWNTDLNSPYAELNIRARLQTLTEQASDGSSVAGKPGDRARPKSAEVSDPHDVAPGVNDGPEDWEDYYTKHPFGGNRDKSVDDVDNVMKDIGAYFGEGVDQEVIEKAYNLVVGVRNEQAEHSAFLEEQYERFTEDSPFNRFCVENNISPDHREAMLEKAEALDFRGRVQFEDESVLKYLMKRTAR